MSTATLERLPEPASAADTSLDAFMAGLAGSAGFADAGLAATNGSNIFGAAKMGSGPSPLKVVQFLGRLYQLAEKDEQKAVDAVYDFMDDHLLAAEFEVCETTLEAARPEKLPHSSIVSFLIVTQRARERLGAGRTGFHEKAMAAVAAASGRDYAEKLLGNYR